MLSINHEIIKEDLHKGSNEVLEDLRDDALKCGGGYFQAEHRIHSYEYTPLYYAGCFLLIIRVHSNLIIATETVEKTITIMVGHRIKDVVHEWEWKGIRDHGDVKFPIIHADPDLSILFWEDHNTT